MLGSVDLWGTSDCSTQVIILVRLSRCEMQVCCRRFMMQGFVEASRPAVVRQGPISWRFD